MKSQYVDELKAGQSVKEIFVLGKKIVKDNLNVREIESLAGMTRSKPRAGKAKKEKPAHIADLENTMSRHLATRVSIDEKRGGKGKITIEFYSHEEFERLVDLMHIPLPR